MVWKFSASASSCPPPSGSPPSLPCFALSGPSGWASGARPCRYVGHRLRDCALSCRGAVGRVAGGLRCGRGTALSATAGCGRASRRELRACTRSAAGGLGGHPPHAHAHTRAHAQTTRTRTHTRMHTHTTQTHTHTHMLTHRPHAHAQTAHTCTPPTACFSGEPRSPRAGSGRGSCPSYSWSLSHLQRLTRGPDDPQPPVTPSPSGGVAHGGHCRRPIVGAPCATQTPNAKTQVRRLVCGVPPHAMSGVPVAG